MIEHVREIFRYSDMTKSLVHRELRGKYKGSILGFLWTFINPLCQIIVYTLVFSVIIKSNLNNFYVYVIVGMIPWLFFDASMRIGSGCVRYQGDMIKKIYFPREVLPIACVTANFINMLFCFIIVFMVLFFSGTGFSPEALYFLPLLLGLEYIMVLGFTLIISAITVYFKDMEHIVTVVLMAWIYLTPVLYPLEIIPDGIRWVFMLNPMTSIIEAFHQIFYWKSVPHPKLLLYALMVSLVLLVAGELIFKRLNDNFAEEL